MPRLGDVRAFFRRNRQPLDFDLADTQAGGLASVFTAHGAGRNGSSSPLRRTVRATAITRTPESDAPDRIADALSRQSLASERIANRLDRIAPVAQSIADMNRRVTGLTELISDLAARSERSKRASDQSQAELIRSVEEQTTALGLLHERMIADARRDAERTELIDSLRNALSDQAGSNTDVANALRHLSDTTTRERADRTTIDRRTQRLLIVVAGVSAIAIIFAAAGLLIIALR